MPVNSFRPLIILYFLLLVRVKIKKWYTHAGLQDKIITTEKVTKKESTEDKISKPYVAKVCGKLFIVNLSGFIKVHTTKTPHVQ